MLWRVLLSSFFSLSFCFQTPQPPFVKHHVNALGFHALLPLNSHSFTAANIFRDKLTSSRIVTTNKRFSFPKPQPRFGSPNLSSFDGIIIETVAPIGVAFSVNTILAIFGLITKKYKSALTLNGLLHAWFLGVTLWTFMGFAGWSTCVLYLVIGSLATKIKQKEKEAQGIAEARGGQRGPENVWGSALTGALCAILSVVFPESNAMFELGFVASIATKTSDTAASEVGKAFGKTTYLITTLRQVPAGTEGAVSLEGTLAGVAASLVIAGYGAWVGLVGPAGAGLCVVAALAATTAESFLGASVQGKVPMLTNEVVNFINTAIGAVVAMGGAALLGL